MSREPQTPEEGSADEMSDQRYGGGMSERERAELHQRIMNLRADKAGLQPSPLRLAYRDGHRDARHAAAELVAALTVVGDAPQCEWREIATAPKDGTIIDVWLGDASDEDIEFYCAPGTRRSAGWHFRQGRFRPYMGLSLPVVTVRPTHWMHLPAPPVPLVLRPAEERQ